MRDDEHDQEPSKQESLPTDNTRHFASSGAASTLLVRVRTFWVLVSPQTKLKITCAVYSTSDGLELRAGQGEHDQLLVLKAAGNGPAEAFARHWHRLAIEKGYQDVPVPAEPSLRTRILEWLWRGHAGTRTSVEPDAENRSLKVSCALQDRIPRG